MKRALPFIVLGLVASCAPAASSPEPPAALVEGDVYAGSAIAQKVCIQCHDIGIEGMPPQTTVNAPDFVVTANRGGMTAAQLRGWMRSTHPIMPTFMFSDEVVSDLAAYIMSLRKPE